MTIASILCVVDGGPGTASSVACGFEVGRRCDAYLEVLHVEPDPNESIPLVGEGMSGAMVEQVLTDLKASGEQNAREAERLFNAQCAAVDMAPVAADGHREPGKFLAAWRKVVGREDAETARRALIFDLIIVSRPSEPSESAYAPALEAALFESGRPVLVAPPEPPPTLGTTAVLAWNGTREAARAVTAALPLLAGAKQVVVLSLKERGKEEEDPAGLSGYLALHGIECRSEQAAVEKTTGASLLAQAERHDADLLVMGAYGHSRLREFILGGATRDVLTGSGMPLFMAH